MTVLWGVMVLAFAPAYAGDTVVPPQKTQSLEILKKKMADEEAKQAKLAKQAKDAEKDIASTKSNMVELGAKIRNNEAGLRDLEKRVGELTTQEQVLKAKLENDHGSIATTILALERMRRVPPELMIIRPGAPLATAQTAMLLQNLLPALDHRAQSISTDIKNLRDVQDKLASDQKSLRDSKASLDKQNAELSKLMEAREKEFKSTNAAYKFSAARAARFAAEAQSLAELVSRIEQDSPRTADRSGDPAPRKRSKSSGSLKGLGKGIWPASGRMVARFGDYDGLGAEIMGVKIGASPKSIVVTPIQGIVKYSGAFRSYGQLVIVEHANGYHSLIAGMDRVNVGIGQKLKTGNRSDICRHHLPGRSPDAIL
jgi:septal ring factor EnvC (AmiA/AmiB activator)